MLLVQLASIVFVSCREEMDVNMRRKFFVINVPHLSSQMVTGTFTGTLLVVYISILPSESLTAQCFVTYFLMRRGR